MTWTFAADGNDAPMPFVQQGRAQAGRGRAHFGQPVANGGARPWTIRCTEFFLLLYFLFCFLKKVPCWVRPFMEPDLQPWPFGRRPGELGAQWGVVP
jgi:hypothetical protein